MDPLYEKAMEQYVRRKAYYKEYQKKKPDVCAKHTKKYMATLRQDSERHAAHKAKVREQYRARRAKKMEQLLAQQQAEVEEEKKEEQVPCYDIADDFECPVMSSLVDRKLIDYKSISALYEATDCGDW